MARCHKVLFVAKSDRLSSDPTNKDERATDSCFALIAHQGILMVDAWWLAASTYVYPPQVKYLWFQQKQVEADWETVKA